MLSAAGYFEVGTIIFLFPNEALRFVYIVINIIIIAAVALCLSHLEN